MSSAEIFRDSSNTHVSGRDVLKRGQMQVNSGSGSRHPSVGKYLPRVNYCVEQTFRIADQSFVVITKLYEEVQ